MSGNDVENRQVWNVALAAQLPGKLVLVGITYFGADGKFIEQQQFYGRVQSVDERKGILLGLEGGRAGEQYNLPPDMRSLLVAQPGEYRLRSTGETVLDPDFTVVFSLRKHVNG